MRTKQRNYFLLVVLGLLSFSCSKDSSSNKNKTSLPTYSNVNLDNIFTKEDRILKNSNDLSDTLNLYYKTIWEDLDLSGGILIAKADQIIFERYRGFGREGRQMPIDQNTPLHIASVSKSLTAMAVLKLVESGKLQLHQTIHSIFPKFPYKDIQIIHLLNHRSGLPKYEYLIHELKIDLGNKFLTNQNILEILTKYHPPQEKPTNRGFMYCNTNYALLALVIEKISHLPYPIAMQKILFQPLKMNHTLVFQEKDIPTVSQSFYNNAGKLYPLNNLDLVYGDKNIYTTPRDLFNFSKALYSNNFLRKDLMEQVFTPYSNEKEGINNYGLGFRMKILNNGEKLVYHNGWWHGSNAVFVHLLKSKISIIALGNKYSRRIYSGLFLASLFEDFPLQKEHLKKELQKGKDSLGGSSEQYTE